MYVDDLVLLGDRKDEIEIRYGNWVRAMEEKGLKVNVNETKAFYTGENVISNVAVKYSCSANERRVGRNSIQCAKSVTNGCTRNVQKSHRIGKK